MEAAKRIVFVKDVVPRFTPAGQRTFEMGCKGVIFNDMWKVAKTCKPSEVEDIVMSMYSTQKYKMFGITVDMVKEMCRLVFKKRTHLLMLRVVDEFCGNPLYATDQHVQKAIVNYIENRNLIARKKYVKKLLRSAHAAFFGIGRELKWEDNDILTYPPQLAQLAGQPLMNTGNPMTEAVKTFVLDEFKILATGRATRYMVKTVKKVGVKRSIKAMESADEEDGVSENKAPTSLVKHGLPVSVAVVMFIIIELFQQLLVDVSRLNDTKRLVNVANLILLYMFCVHEGCRVTELIQQTTHNNLQFSLGEEFKLLSLVFVKPETFAYLLQSGHIKKYVCEFFKGKKEQKYRGRFISWVPPAYNVIDLATMYVILTRIIVALEPKMLTKLVFKQNVNYSALNQRINKKLNITGLCFYSIRYGAAEDDIKYNIPAQWTRYRMGHAAYSNMKNMYASNLNQRVLIDNVMTLLGVDVVDTPTDENVIPLRFIPVNCAINHQAVPQDVPQEVMDDLRKAKRGVRAFMSGNVCVSDIPELVDAIPKSKDDLFRDLKKIPLGSFITFKEEMLTPTMVSEVNANSSVIGRFFAAVQEPNNTPMLWSYPQVMFGVWRPEEVDAAKQEWNALKAKEVLMEIKDLIDKVDGAPATTFPKSVTDSRKRKKVEKKVQEIKDDTGIYYVSDIEVGDVVAVVCPDQSPQNDNIQLPNTNTYIWLCHVSSVEPYNKSTNSPYVVQGHFYNGSIDALMYGEKQTIVVANAALITIFYSKLIEDPTHLKLEDDEIEGMCKYVRDWDDE
jgi:hypothetical protein